jgi:hypothetical protein
MCPVMELQETERKGEREKKEGDRREKKNKREKEK